MLLNDARQQIADACSHLSDDGLVVGTAGNLSVREGDLVAITPSGLPYQEMRPRPGSPWSSTPPASRSRGRSSPPAS